LKSPEEAVLGVGIVLLLAVNYALLRPTFKPLERLAERMKNVRPPSPRAHADGERLE
jgi:hypothetical protein